MDIERQKDFFRFVRYKFKFFFLSVIVAIAYYLSAKFGLLLSFKPDYISALWPPNAILLSALLLTKPLYWVWFLIAIIPAELAADLPAGISLKMSLGFILSDWLEVLTASILFRKFSTKPIDFCSMKQLFIYIIICVLTAPFVSAFTGAIATGIDSIEVPYLIRWSRWFAGDALTHLLFTPFIVLWMPYKFKKLRLISVLFYVEIVLLLVILFVVGLIAFSGIIQGIERYPALLYTPLPILLWASVRFGPRGIFSSSLFVAVISVWSASKGSGPFVLSSASENVIHLQIYLLMILTPLLFLAALIETQIKTKDDLEKSEKKFRAIADTSPFAIVAMSEGAEQNVVYVNPTFTTLFGYTIDEVPNVEHWWPLAYPDINYRKKIVDEWQAKVKHAIRTKSEIEPMEVVVTSKDGAQKNISWGFITMGKENWAFGIDLTERKKADEEKESLIAELQKALLEIKTLRGILPICSHCKKIRDDNGYWNQIESYIDKHSDAKFSHGMCPECSDRIYGKENWYIEMKKKKNNNK